MTLQKTALKVIQVAKTKLLNPETGKQFTCKYSDVPKDSNDWVTDLTYLRIEGKWRVLSGWLQGTKWVGLRIRAGDKVIAWKRNIDEIRYILGKRDII
jgi:hypothetical protein